MFRTNRFIDVRHGFYRALQGYYDDNEARTLFRYVFEYFTGGKIYLFQLAPERTLSESVLRDLIAAIADLKIYKPYQYITGSASFCGLEIRVTPSVLIPRPETEELVLLLVSHVKEKKLLDNLPSTRFRILDSCTGSGCIALAIKHLLPEAEVFAFDVASDAIEVASGNAQDLGLEIRVFEGDLLAGLPDLPLMNLIICNPPYISESEQKVMHPRVLEYEPAQALFVPDETPLVFYDALTRLCQRSLSQDGAIFMEVNENLGDEVLSLFKEKGFWNTSLLSDFRGKNRFVIASH